MVKFFPASGVHVKDRSMVFERVQAQDNGVYNGTWYTGLRGKVRSGTMDSLKSCDHVVLHLGEMFARRALGARPARYLSINYPDFSPRFTLSWRRPPK